jgi:hypothetical protein
MKKNFYKSRLKGIIFLLFAGLNIAHASVDNLNFSFEDLDGQNFPLNWVPSYTTSMVTSSTAESFNGAKSIKISDISSSLNTGARSHSINNVTVGRIYQVTSMCYVESGSAYLYLEFWDSQNTRIGVHSESNTETGKWEKIKVSGTAPANTAYITVLVYSSVGNIGTSYFDCINLSELPNSSFEVVESGFAKYWNKTHNVSSVTLNTSSSYSFSGSNSIKIDDNSSNSGAGLRSSRFYDVSNYDMYCAEVMCKALSGEARLYIEFWDEDDERISDCYSEIKQSSNWQKISVSAIAPIQTKYITIMFYSTISNIGELYFDNANINVIKNYGFDNPDDTQLFPADWIEIPNTILGASTLSNQYASNSYCGVKINDNISNKGAGIRSSKLYNITPNTMYKGSVKSYIESGNSARLYIKFWDAQDNLLSYQYSDNLVANSWQTINVSGVAPANTSYATFSVYSLSGNVGICYFDNIMTNEETIDIGFRKQLFIDDYIVDETNNMSSELHYAQKTQINFADRASYKNVDIYGTVLKDGNQYKMWHYATDFSDTTYLLYRTSTDGINWSNGLDTYNNGSTINNIEINGIVKDPVSNEYLMFGNYIYYVSGKKKFKYATLSSTDGINWNEEAFHFGTNPFGSNYSIGDVASMAYDEETNKYIVSYKINDNVSDPGCQAMEREFYNAISDDLITLSEGYKMYGLADDLDIDYYENRENTTIEGADCYGVGLFPYEGVYIGFNWLFYITECINANHHDGPIEVQLVFSRDLQKQWQKPFRESIIPMGANGEWDDGMIVTASYPIVDNDTIKLYYGGWDGTHRGDVSRTCNIGLAEWRLDGFVSLNSGSTQGVITTKKIFPLGDYLSLNADASNNGEIIIEVYNEHGDLLRKSNPITNNVIDELVTWDISNVSYLKERTLYLKIYSKNAKIYSFQFRENQTKSTSKNASFKNDVDLKNSIKIYPNPTDNILIIKDIPLNSTVFLSDIQGKELFRLENSPTYYNLEMSDYESGIYFLSIKSMNSQFTKKIIKR